MYAKTVNPVLSSPKTRETYLAWLESSLAGAAPGAERDTLVVLPGNLGLLLAFAWGDLGSSSESFYDAYTRYARLPSSWLEEFLALHREAARGAGVYLVPGTYIHKGPAGAFLASCLLSPAGHVLLEQRQVFLSRQERFLGLSRGDTLEVASLGREREREALKAGLILGTDSFYPETGRILAMQGANVVCHPGCLGQGTSSWVQVAGMWQQVQQNQFFCIESQLHAGIAGENFGTPSIVHGPCEMTTGLTGILARGESPGDPASAFLDNAERLKVIEKYSILKLLNPAAYGTLGHPGEEGYSSC